MAEKVKNEIFHTFITVFGPCQIFWGNNPKITCVKINYRLQAILTNVFFV